MTVISVTRETVGNLSAKWITTDKRALVDHWVQFQILEELIEQCRMFSNYADKVGKKRISQSYTKVEIILTKILDEKKENNQYSETRDRNHYTSLVALEKILSS